LLTRITRENAATIVDYIMAFRNEIDPAPSYRIETINRLKDLAEFHDPSSPIWQKRHNDLCQGLTREEILSRYKPKLFKQMTRDDNVEFLYRLRKPETDDPTHKWKGTHETNRIILLRFFKWLYCPDPNNTPPKKRKTPEVMQNIEKLERKEGEQDIYKDSDMWTAEDDLLFCKYCPRGIRLSLWLIEMWGTGEASL
jgi:hypothetical protein